jgi:hypothetical protein
VFSNAPAFIVVTDDGNRLPSGTGSEISNEPRVWSAVQLRNALAGMVVNVPNDTDSRALHSAKAYELIELRFGMNTDVMPLPANGLTSLSVDMVVREVKFNGETSEEQPLKASSLIVVMNSSEISDNNAHPENAEDLIVTPELNVTEVRLVHP